MFRHEVYGAAVFAALPRGPALLIPYFASQELFGSLLQFRNSQSVSVVDQKVNLGLRRLGDGGGGCGRSIPLNPHGH